MADTVSMTAFEFDRLLYIYMRIPKNAVLKPTEILFGTGLDNQWCRPQVQECHTMINEIRFTVTML